MYRKWSNNYPYRRRGVVWVGERGEGREASGGAEEGKRTLEGFDDFDV